MVLYSHMWGLGDDNKENTAAVQNKKAKETLKLTGNAEKAKKTLKLTGNAKKATKPNGGGGGGGGGGDGDGNPFHGHICSSADISVQILIQQLCAGI